MLQSILKEIKNQEDTIDFTILLSENYAPDILAYQPYRTIHYPKNITDLAELARIYDKVLFAGGAILNDESYSREDLNFNTLVVELSSLFIANNKQSLFYGVSSSSKIYNQSYIEKLRFAIEGSFYVSLRDNFSLKTLKDARIDTSHIKIVEDLIFTDPALSTVCKAKNNSKKNKYGAVFVYTEENFDTILSFTKNFLSFMNKQDSLLIIPFYDFEGHDIKFANRLLQELNDNRISMKLQIATTMAELTVTIASLDAIISMRYHGTLIATALGKRVLSIDLSNHAHYLNKNKYIYEHYGIKGLHIKDTDIEKFSHTDFKKFLSNNGKTPNTKLVHRAAQKQLRLMLNDLYQ